YSDTDGLPTMDGLMRYLKANWIPTLAGHDGVGIDWQMLPHGIDISVKLDATITRKIGLALGAENAKSIGFRFVGDPDATNPGEVNLDALVHAVVDLHLKVDTDTGDVSFDVNKLSLQASLKNDHL